LRAGNSNVCTPWVTSIALTRTSIWEVAAVVPKGTAVSVPLSPCSGAYTANPPPSDAALTVGRLIPLVSVLASVVFDHDLPSTDVSRIR